MMCILHKFAMENMFVKCSWWINITETLKTNIAYHYSIEMTLHNWCLYLFNELNVISILYKIICACSFVIFSNVCIYCIRMLRLISLIKYIEYVLLKQLSSFQFKGSFEVYIISIQLAIDHTPKFHGALSSTMVRY